MPTIVAAGRGIYVHAMAMTKMTREADPAIGKAIFHPDKERHEEMRGIEDHKIVPEPMTYVYGWSFINAGQHSALALVDMPMQCCLIPNAVRRCRIEVLRQHI